MPRGKVEASAEVWRDRVQRWRASGLTSREFAEREGIARPQALSWWACRLSRRGANTSRASAGTAVRVIKLEAAAKYGPRTSAVEIVTATGARVLVHGNTDEEALGCALRALGVRS